MSSNHEHDSIVTAKRVFLRLHSSVASKESEIIQAFLKNSGCAESENLHFIHYEPPQYSHYHIIIDMNYIQVADPDFANLPHEIYKVSFKDGENDP